MKKIALILVVIMLFMCCGCTQKYSFEYKSMPENYEVTEKEFTVYYTDVTEYAEGLLSTYSVQRITHPDGLPYKLYDWFAEESDYANYNAAIKKYTLDYFENKQLLVFVLPLTTGKEQYEISRITNYKDSITRIYIDLSESEKAISDKTSRIAIVETDKFETNLIDCYVDSQQKNPTQTISKNQNGISLEMTLPEGWGYSEIENRSDRVGFDIGPQKYGGSGLWVYYNKNEINGLCGTGLKTGRMKIGKYNASASCYDNAYPFTYVDIEVAGDYYGLANVNASHWWAEYKDDLQQIFDSLKLGENEPSTEDLEFYAQYVRTGVEYTPKLPYVAVIRSKEQLKSYIERFAVDADRDNSKYSDGTISFNMAAEKYTDEFFENNQIVMCMIEETSGSIRHKVDKVQLINGIGLDISIIRDIPEICTDDMALWHIFVETPKINIADDEVEILIDGKNTSPNIDAVYSKANIGIKLSLKEGWTYDIIEEIDRCGISFYPESDTSTGIRVVYLKEDYKEEVYDPPYLNPIVTEPVTVGVYSGKIRRYKSDGSWNSINLDILDGKIHIFNSGAVDFEKKYEEDVLEILETIEIFDDSITKEEAVKAAKDASVINFTEESATYDKESGVWVVTLKNSEMTETYKVDKNGYTAVATPTKEG